MLKSNDTDDIIYVGNDGKSSSEYSGDSLPVFVVLVQKERICVMLTNIHLNNARGAKNDELCLSIQTVEGAL